jgi:hypothetical protein
MPHQMKIQMTIRDDNPDDKARADNFSYLYVPNNLSRSISWRKQSNQTGLFDSVLSLANQTGLFDSALNLIGQMIGRTKLLRTNGELKFYSQMTKQNDGW